MLKSELVWIPLVTCCLLLLTTSAFAQEEEHQDGGPGDCIATWDPFCPRGTPSGGEGGGGGTNICSTCEWIPEGPNGQPAEWICAVSNGPCCESTLAYCEPLVNGCHHNGYCVWA